MPWLEPVFAATPPLDSLRTLMVKAASRWGRTGKSLSVQIVDVSRAHFYADAIRDVFVKLPQEDPRACEEGICGKLQKTMYGTLDAAEQWSAHYCSVLASAGFKKGSSSPCHFHHPERDVWMIVHGDDFVSIGESSDQEFVKASLEKTL